MNARMPVAASLLLLVLGTQEANALDLSVDIGRLYAAPYESALRAMLHRGDSLPEVGISGQLGLGRWGALRLHALAAWAVIQTEGHVADAMDLRTLEHSFVLGGRVGWARFWFAQPYFAVRGGAALGWVDVVPEDQGEAGGRLESFDVAFRVEPAVGVEGFIPFRLLSAGLPGLFEATRSPAGSDPAGLGIGCELGYRLQTSYDVDAALPEPEDDDIARDAIPREGTSLGALSLRGVRLGLKVFVRF